MAIKWLGDGEDTCYLVFYQTSNILQIDSAALADCEILLEFRQTMLTSPDTSHNT